MLKRTTVYLDPKIHRAIKMQSAQSSVSVSDLVNHALKLSLKENMMDLESIRKRKGEGSRPFEDVLKELKHDGLI